ncbi:ACT domain-containing protein ACR1 [Camellia lanceoleosa]|uniref:ACT domain-containing protein ACR1 n=1 Tax=Camellia lanceoleosa TaxID=1840588 RepID=A0ACC0HXL2_9ERIC|nr:ACT domain-containing protein ACR1 [Camellia lanceoleosa]
MPRLHACEDSANKHGILLEIVQVLTDLDLAISKSYISSDGGWFMDGNAWNRSKDVQTYLGNDEVRPPHVSIEHTAFEITGMDRPGQISEISAVLTELGCLVNAAVAWSHNSRMACIIHVEEECKGGKPITEVQAQLENVVEAHHCDGEKRRPTPKGDSTS